MFKTASKDEIKLPEGEAQLIEAAKSSAADKDFFTAALSALRSARQDELLPREDRNGDLQHTIRQGLKAACHGRQDVAAILIIQHSLLRRLALLQKLHWITLFVLVYIASRLQ